MTDPHNAPAASAAAAPTIHANPEARSWRTERAPEVIDFHRSIPGYAPTRLIEVPALAAELGIARVLVKEESARFGLPAFKILGASYAACRALSARLGSPEAALPMDELRTRLAERAPIELVAATDGNHGRAVAHTARLLGLPAHIFLPADITAEAKAGIREEGADVDELSAPYDAIVAAAAEYTDAGEAAGEERLLIQDTSWEGYEEIPQWIVDGYSTLLVEAEQQLAEQGIERVDLVAMPVGVGSFAEAVVRRGRTADGGLLSGGTAADTRREVSSLRNPAENRSEVTTRAEEAPALSVLSVEPTAAPGLIASLAAGELTAVPTGATIMAGLNCGTPSAAAWPVLRAGVDAAVTVDDAQAAQAVRDLEAHGVDSGPCGASTLAGVRAWVDAHPLPADATVLLLSTESRRANPLPAGMGGAVPCRP